MKGTSLARSKSMLKRPGLMQRLTYFHFFCFTFTTICVGHSMQYSKFKFVNDKENGQDKNISICTMSWELWKHPYPPPGGRPLFFKPEWPKESKNWFKIISCRRYRIVFFFSNYFFRYLKSSKRLDGFTSNSFPDNLNSMKCSIDTFSDIRAT